MSKRSDNIVHVSFDIGILLKAIEAIIEILLGIGLIFITPTIMENVGDYITEFMTNAPFADIMAEFAYSYSVDAQRFIVFYMLSHGIVKLVVIFMLWRQKLLAYPLSIGMFSFFIIYQIYHHETINSFILISLTILDIIMIVLTVLEYRRLRAEGKWDFFFNKNK